MAKNQMICEPNTSLPQKFVLEPDMSISAVDKKEEIKKPPVARGFAPETQIEYNVLPLFHRPDEEFKEQLSIDTNEYFRCKWGKFLEKVPDCYVNIKLYKDVVPRANLQRKISLNGQFYGPDNKLAPIPVMDDPRQYNLKHSNSSRNKCPP